MHCCSVQEQSRKLHWDERWVLLKSKPCIQVVQPQSLNEVNVCRIHCTFLRMKPIKRVRTQDVMILEPENFTLVDIAAILQMSISRTGKKKFVLS